MSNSTNNTYFKTGILWDSSDSNPGEYNGSQDLVFVTKISPTTSGKYGISDFEMKIPSNLKQLVPPTDSVSFYFELR